jgi:hypothetical protein
MLFDSKNPTQRVYDANHKEESAKDLLHTNFPIHVLGLIIKNVFTLRPAKNHVTNESLTVDQGCEIMMAGQTFHTP